MKVQAELSPGIGQLGQDTAYIFPYRRAKCRDSLLLSFLCEGCHNALAGRCGGTSFIQPTSKPWLRHALTTCGGSGLGTALVSGCALAKTPSRQPPTGPVLPGSTTFFRAYPWSPLASGSVTDIEAIASVARKAGVPLIVDNTLATPYLIKPIDHGADIVVHSLTKFLGGHGNSLGGIIVDAGTFDWSKDNKYPMLSEPRPEYHGIKIQETFGNFAFAIACRVLGLRDLGPALSPFNAFMILTGIETLPLRMQKHCENAKAVAEFLTGHPKVAAVNYAGLANDKYNNLARKYAPKGAGAVFTFSLKGGYDAGVSLVSNLKLFSHLANVGDTRSLVIHPASTTHSQLDDAAKIRSGAGPDVVRLSIGIEDKEDLIADLEQALNA